MNADQLYALIVQPINLLFFSLVALGVVLKNTNKVSDWLIPPVLGVVGVVLGYFLIGHVQGALVGFIFAAVSVYGHQIITQWGKKDELPIPQPPVPKTPPTLLLLVLGLSLGSFGCATTQTTILTPEQKAEHAAEWVRNASGLLEAGVAAAVQVGVYSANQNDPEEIARINSVMSTVSSNVYALISAGKTDPESVRQALKVNEAYFDPIMAGVAQLYASQYQRLQKNGYADLSIEILKALAKGVADGTAR